MKFCQQLSALSRLRAPIVLAVGFFDGVHVGHQAIIRRAVTTARRLNGAAWILTFDAHPLKVISPESVPCLVTGMPHKLRLFETLKPDGCLAMPFTPTLAACEPEDFIADLVKKTPNLAAVCVGCNFSFGRDGRGHPELLGELAARHGFKALIIPPVCRLGTPVSSTRVRRLVAEGRLDDAAVLLGRPFSLLGKVVSGRRLGRQMGVPTANLATADEAHPPPGVFVVRVLLGHRKLFGVANLGFRPTVTDTAVVAPIMQLETHILDFDEDIYDRELEVIFLRRIRSERRFDSLDQLRDQIERDIQYARAWRKSAN